MATLEQRFNNLLSEYGRGFKKKDVKGKKNQEEFSYLVNEIKRYGFKFEPEHYVAPLVNRLERLVKNQ